jgi:hypothetical protein
MEASTTIKQMLAGNRIFVPTYQRAYSWDTEFERSKAPKQVNVFLSALRGVRHDHPDRRAWCFHQAHTAE